MREGAAGAAKSSKKLFEPFLKMNIDEGGGGKIVQKLVFLTRFTSFRIAPMFYLILPPPLRNLPYQVSELENQQLFETSRFKVL